MANRIFRPDVASPNAGLVIIPGSVLINSGGIPLSDTLSYVSASRQAAGTIRLTFEDAFVNPKAFLMTLENTGSQVMTARVSGSLVNTASKYMDVQTITGSSGLAADAGNRMTLHFVAFLQNSYTNG